MEPTVLLLSRQYYQFLPFVVVKHRITNDIAVIEISNPPVNAISAAVRTELLQTVNKLSKEKNIKAIVITAPERTFLAGADIKEFGKDIDAPILSEICDKIENFLSKFNIHSTNSSSADNWIFDH